jgi:hypothetical protein
MFFQFAANQSFMDLIEISGQEFMEFNMILHPIEKTKEP